MPEKKNVLNALNPLPTYLYKQPDDDPFRSKTCSVIMETKTFVFTIKMQVVLDYLP